MGDEQVPCLLKWKKFQDSLPSATNPQLSSHSSSPVHPPSARAPGNKITKYWKAVLVSLMTIVIIILFHVFLKHPQTTECSGKWIGVRDDCFYFSNETKNWIDSKRFCNSQGAELAQIDTQETMEFLKKHTGTSMHWIGLSRNQGESWKWTNGTTFNTWFEITGNGSFAFLNAGGVYSSRGLIDINWICSKSRF